MEFSELIRRRRMVRAFTGEPLAPGTTERLLRAANRAPSAGFSQGSSFLVLEGKEQSAPLWKILYDASVSEDTTDDDGPAQVTALSHAPLVIIPLACKDIYLAGKHGRLPHAVQCAGGVGTDWGHRGRPPRPGRRPGPARAGQRPQNP